MLRMINNSRNNAEGVNQGDFSFIRLITGED